MNPKRYICAIPKSSLRILQAGTCTKGASCTFAHGDADLQMDAVSPAAAATAPCAVAATAFGGTSLADAIAQSLWAESGVRELKDVVLMRCLIHQPNFTSSTFQTKVFWPSVV